MVFRVEQQLAGAVAAVDGGRAAALVRKAGRLLLQRQLGMAFNSWIAHIDDIK